MHMHIHVCVCAGMCVCGALLIDHHVAANQLGFHQLAVLDLHEDHVGAGFMLCWDFYRELNWNVSSCARGLFSMLDEDYLSGRRALT